MFEQLIADLIVTEPELTMLLILAWCLYLYFVAKEDLKNHKEKKQ